MQNNASILAVSNLFLLVLCAVVTYIRCLGYCIGVVLEYNVALLCSSGHFLCGLLPVFGATSVGSQAHACDNETGRALVCAPVGLEYSLRRVISCRS